MPDLDALYREVVLDHYRSPRGRSDISDPDISNEGLNPLCGDDVKVKLKLGNEEIRAAHVGGRGCSICTASGSMMAELLPGLTCRAARRLADGFKRAMRGEPWPAGLEHGDLEALEGVRNFPVRIKCALLPWITLDEALDARARGLVHPDRPSSTETSGSDR